MSDRQHAVTVELFTQDHCRGCEDVKRYLEERGVTFTMRRVDEDAAALEELSARGYMTTPVTRVGDDWIAGFKRRDLERALRALGF